MPARRWLSCVPGIGAGPEVLDQRPHLLGSRFLTDQKRVARLHHDEVLDSNCSDELPWYVKEAGLRIDEDVIPCNRVALHVLRQDRMQLGPRTNIDPVEP